MFSSVCRKIENKFSSYYHRGSSKLAASAVEVIASAAGAGSLKRLLGVPYCRVNSQKLRTVGLKGMHSNLEDVQLGGMYVKILPALQDNYMYLIVDKNTREAAVVDPVDPELVIKTVQEEEVDLNQVLTTHHHWDHAGGNEKLVRLWKGELEVYGGDDRIAAVTHKVRHNDIFNIGYMKLRCLSTPCHTSSHICYHVTDPNSQGAGAVFTGDTLFQAGCGRFFEGTPEQMYDALCTKLSALPDETKVFCGHEYTLQNLFYARHVEPDSTIIQNRIEWAKLRRAAEDTTMPSTIGEEKSWNPFMRVHESTVQAHTGVVENPIGTMGALRKEKDNFKG